MAAAAGCSGLSYHDAAQDALKEEIRLRKVAEHLAAHRPDCAVPTAVPPEAPPRARPSAADRARAAFGVLDRNGSGVIEPQEWADGVRACNLGLSDETIADLYQRLGDGGGAAWAAFCSARPALVDAIFYRQQQAVRAEAQRRASDALRQPLSESIERAEASLRAAQKELDDEQANLQSIEAELPRAEEALGEAQHALQVASIAAEERAAARDQLRCELARLWPEQTRRSVDLRGAELECQGLARRVADMLQQERALEAALAQHRSDRESLEAAWRAAETNLDRLSLMAKEGEEPERRLREAEAALQEARQAEQQAFDLLGRVQTDLEVAGCRQEQAEHRVRSATHRVHSAERVLSSAELAAAENTETLLAAAAAAGHGPAMGPDGELTELGKRENDLVHREVRLREQRDDLERRETALLQEHTVFARPRAAPPPPQTTA
eukprot:TRINITY_DN70601_c0_g1_i1.p1 TRINITY_DN70601_c0_g1~~TRINITY_DN70601_c0_g1_i1.p1  ORF type:complete len:471 (+),score=167.10 TRINITY_DN70601_c0_g1_i1:96-1415(+)